MLNAVDGAVSIEGHVCAIENPRLANGVVVTLVGLSVTAAAWLVATMLAGV